MSQNLNQQNPDDYNTINILIENHNKQKISKDNKEKVLKFFNKNNLEIKEKLLLLSALNLEIVTSNDFEENSTSRDFVNKIKESDDLMSKIINNAHNAKNSDNEIKEITKLFTENFVNLAGFDENQKTKHTEFLEMIITNMASNKEFQRQYSKFLKIKNISGIVGNAGIALAVIGVILFAALSVSSLVSANHDVGPFGSEYVGVLISIVLLAPTMFLIDLIPVVIGIVGKITESVYGKKIDNEIKHNSAAAKKVMENVGLCIEHLNKDATNVKDIAKQLNIKYSNDPQNIDYNPNVDIKTKIIEEYTSKLSNVIKDVSTGSFSKDVTLSKKITKLNKKIGIGQTQQI